MLSHDSHDSAMRAAGAWHTSCDVDRKLHKALTQRCMQVLSGKSHVEVWKDVSTLDQAITVGAKLELAT